MTFDADLDVRDALVSLSRQLAASGIENPARDARLLLAAALGVTGADLIRSPERRIGLVEAGRLAEFVRRRVAHEPVSRILGERGFYGRSFRITPATLDPRPATETVVDAALEIADREGWRERAIRILDVGTGSGALLLTLLAELPRATGLGTDISDEALAVARDNAERLGLSHRATFANRRSLEGFTTDGAGVRFDLLVSNPPYIPSGDIAGLEAEVREFDPRGALDGGNDGLSVYKELAAGVLDVVPDGWMMVEVGAGQAEDLVRLVEATLAPSATREIKFWKDLEQHTRCVAVRTQR